MGERAGSLDYLCSEGRENADWVKNIRHNPAVQYGFGGWHGDKAHATARVIDDPALIHTLTRLFDARYQWSDGAFVEIKPDPL